MTVWILGNYDRIISVFANKESAIQYVTIDYPEAKFDEDGNWEGYWVESWDVI